MLASSSFPGLTLRGSNDQVYCNLLLLRFVVLCLFTFLYLAVLLEGSLALSVQPVLLVFLALLLAGSAGYWLYARKVAKSARRNFASAIRRQMVFDYLWLFACVYLSGKSANPIIYYYLVLIAIAASLFSRRESWIFCIAGIVAYSLMLGLDMDEHSAHLDQGFRLHLLGMWLNFIGAAIITCLFVGNLSATLRRQQAELLRIRETHLKNEQLIGIGTVAASTVHALATPLSTLQMLIDELLAEDGQTQEGKRDLVLMQAQIQRCKDTMKKLSRLGDSGSKEQAEPITDLIEDLSEYYLLNSPGRQPGFELDSSATIAHADCIKYDILFRHALVNLINNALESSDAPVQVKLYPASDGLRVSINNLVSAEHRPLLDAWGKTSISHKTEGLGIGSFLANSTIERLGGSVQLQTGQESEGLLSVNVIVQMPATFYRNPQAGEAPDMCNAF